MAEPWWSADLGPIIGASSGIFGGLSGAASGAIASFFAARGRRRALVTGLFGVQALAGWIFFAIGVFAWASGQPFHVWFPLGFGGFMFAIVYTPLIFTVTQIYRQAEDRRLAAELLRRS